MKITLLTVGKIKEKFYRQAIEEFQKRLKRYCKLELIEVADEKTPDCPSARQLEQILRKEEERLNKYIQAQDYVVALVIEGQQLDSQQLSEKIQTLGLNGTSSITFVIGGSLGLSNELKKRADYCLSFSKMTFPHQLMRVILLEQIYRSFRIAEGAPYHK